MSHLTPEELEKLIHQNLRSLPDRSAPRSLEANVWAAIQAQQAQPWWCQSFVHWPVAARASFLIFTAVLAAALIALFFQMGARVEISAVLSGPEMAFEKTRMFMASLRGFGALLMKHIPSYWITGGLVFVATLYALLIGLGATAYRTLFNQR